MTMISLFIIATLVSLVINLRHAFQMPTEAEVTRLVAGDLRYRRSLGSLFGSMCLSLALMLGAAFFALTGTGEEDRALAFGMLIYYPIYFWVTALGYSEVLAVVAQKRYRIDDPLLRPKLFAITRDRAQRVHGIMAVLLSLLLINKADVAGAWANVVNVLMVVGWMAWIPITLAYYRATARAFRFLYPDALTSGSKVAVILTGFVFHMSISMLVPILIFLVPFLLPRILRRDREMAAG